MKEKAAAREAALKLTTGIAEIAVDAVQVSCCRIAGRRDMLRP